MKHPVAVGNPVPLVSVVVADVAFAASVHETLQSIAEQTYSRIECIIVDGALAPASQGVAAAFGQVVTCWIHQPNQPSAALIQRGLDKATGQFVLVLAGGQALQNPTALAALVASAAADTDVVYGNYERYYPDGRRSEIRLPAVLTADDVLGGVELMLSATLLRRALLREHHFWDDKLRYTHEWAFFLRILLLSPARVKHVSEYVAVVPVGYHGATSRMSDAHLISKEKARVWEQHLPPLLKELIAAKQRCRAIEKRDDQLLLTPALRFFEQAVRRAAGALLRRSLIGLRSLRSVAALAAYRRKHGAACFKIPIVINNRNHLSYLQRLISSLERRGYHNLYILDNASDYPPLLEFYACTPHQVIRLGRNVGFCALWETDAFALFKDTYYVYTDSDLELAEECPVDFMVTLHYLLNTYNFGKVGLSLLTDDLPDHYANKEQVQQWEAQFQRERLERLAFVAAVDTTFALYRPNMGGHTAMLTGLRTRFPYSARHLPWYENSWALTSEQRYYYQHATTSSHWSSQMRTDEVRYSNNR